MAMYASLTFHNCSVFLKAFRFEVLLKGLETSFLPAFKFLMKLLARDRGVSSDYMNKKLRILLYFSSWFGVF